MHCNRKSSHLPSENKERYNAHCQINTGIRTSSMRQEIVKPQTEAAGWAGGEWAHWAWPKKTSEEPPKCSENVVIPPLSNMGTSVEKWAEFLQRKCISPLSFPYALLSQKDKPYNWHYWPITVQKKEQKCLAHYFQLATWLILQWHEHPTVYLLQNNLFQRMNTNWNWFIF